MEISNRKISGKSANTLKLIISKKPEVKIKEKMLNEWKWKCNVQIDSCGKLSKQYLRENYNTEDRTKFKLKVSNTYNIKDQRGNQENINRNMMKESQWNKQSFLWGCNKTNNFAYKLIRTKR